MIDYSQFKKKEVIVKKKNGRRTIPLPLILVAKVYSGSNYRYDIEKLFYCGNLDKMRKVDFFIDNVFCNLRKNESVHSVRCNNKPEILHRFFNPDF